MSTRTVVLVCNVKPGAEQHLTHDLPIEFPAQTLSKIKGIKSVTLCQGNHMLVAIVQYEGDFQQTFEEYISSPSIQAFHFKIEKFLDDPPRSQLPRDLPLAGDVFHWDGRSFNRATN
jgi:hypothetical protein